MAEQLMTVWFDQEGDFLEVRFDSHAPGYLRETDDDRVIKKVDETGRVLGFSVLGPSGFRAPVTLPITAPASEESSAAQVRE